VHVANGSSKSIIHKDLHVHDHKFVIRLIRSVGSPNQWQDALAGVKLDGMNEITRVLSAIEGGDAAAAEQLLPLVYDELRRLAAQKLARERAGQSWQATALVHEAYVRLVDVEKVQHWNGRGRGDATDPC
jgi:hypothetical protein